MLKLNTAADAAQDGPFSGNIQLALQGLSELLADLPDTKISEARRHIESLFEACEAVKNLEGYGASVSLNYSWQQAWAGLTVINRSRAKRGEPPLVVGHA